MSAELQAAIERLRNYKMTPAEKFEQRVSFVYGQQDWSSGRAKSKDEIRQMLIDKDGAPECPRCKELEAELARLREAAELFALAIRDDVPDDKLINTVAWTAGQHRALAKVLAEIERRNLDI